MLGESLISIRLFASKLPRVCMNALISPGEKKEYSAVSTTGSNAVCQMVARSSRMAAV